MINGLHEEGEQQKVGAETAAVSKRVNVKWRGTAREEKVHKQQGVLKPQEDRQEKDSGWCQSIKKRLQEGSTGVTFLTSSHTETRFS